MAHHDASDDAYHEHLWGEASPRAFARRLRIAGARKGSRQTLTVEVGDVDLARFVSR